MVLHISLLCSK